MDAERLNAEGRELWNRKARFWDAMQGDEGNSFHRRLIEPSVLRLLKLQPGERALDACCGNGVMARRLAKEGALVTAFDFSQELVRLAQARPSGSSIDYHVIDATDEAAMLGLGAGRFDAVVCTMALMDMPTLKPLFNAASRLLAAGGRFVYATAHPAFNSNNPIFVHEKEDRGGAVYDHYAVKLRAYLDVPPVKGGGAPDEPNPHYYYHRPLHQLLGDAFEAGFALDALLEPAFSLDDAEASPGLNWFKLWQIPPVLAGRLRLL